MTSAEEHAVEQLEEMIETLDNAIRKLDGGNCKSAIEDIFRFGQLLGQEGGFTSFDVAWGDLPEYDRMATKARHMWDKVKNCKC